MRKIGILGAGESGVGAALLAKKVGFDIWVSDFRQIQQVYRQELIDHQILFEEGRHTLEKFKDAEIIVKSPGIPRDVSILKELRKLAIPIVSEIDFASKFTSSKIIAITGSNGKTTTSSLIYHILFKAGYNVALAGNIGKSFARQLSEKDFMIYVLEVSSFQLENISTFKPDIALILNLSPDHLDRYDFSMEIYGQTKLAISSNQNPEDLFIYWADDKWISRLIEEPGYSRLNKKRFSLNKFEGVDAWIEDEVLYWKDYYHLSKDDIPLIGRHNIMNVLAAGLAIIPFNISQSLFQKAVKSFNAVTHRLEFVARKKGIIFINDSKATNVDAVFYALDSISGKIIWIVGGIDKGNQYELLIELVQSKVKAMIILGEGELKISEAFPSIPYTCAGNMEEAVKLGFKMASDGEFVLLSPACASFDLFKNYEDRGDQFKKYVLDY